jgi:hypothetical protein
MCVPRKNTFMHEENTKKRWSSPNPFAAYEDYFTAAKEGQSGNRTEVVVVLAPTYLISPTGGR